MFDSDLAFNRYRLEVVKSWPDGQLKSQLIASIESALRRHEGQLEQRRPAKSRARKTSAVIPSDY
jgi:hypothetical protein